MKCLLYLFTLLLMLMPHPVFAREQTQKLTANDGAVGDYFGCSVSISSDGNYAVVGAENVDRESADVGAAFVFKKSEDGSWVQQAKLTEKDGTHYDSFGCSVSISSDGSYIVVGARKFNNPGAAYVFKQPDGGWATTDTYTAKLTDKNGSSTAKFGCSVSISSEGSYIAVGAEEMNTDGHATGAAYVFKQPDAGWATTDTYTAMFTDKNSSSTARFGCSVSISSDGGYLVVGAEEMETDGTPAGAAYVFKQPDGGWATTDTYTAMLTDKEGRGGDDFGCSVSVSSDGGYALVGASSHPFTGEFTTGAAYVFKQPDDGWATTDMYAAKLTASDGANDDRFGDSVSISSDGSYILVGANLAPYDSEGSSPRPRRRVCL